MKTTAIVHTASTTASTPVVNCIPSIISRGIRTGQYYGRLLSENELAKAVLDACFDIHRKLGPGLLDAVYEEILSYELIDRGLDIERQKGVPLHWKDIRLSQGFRADLIVNNSLIVEIVSSAEGKSLHSKQLLTYLKVTNMKLGLLINFNERLLKDGISRVVHNLY